MGPVSRLASSGCKSECIEQLSSRVPFEVNQVSLQLQQATYRLHRVTSTLQRCSGGRDDDDGLVAADSTRSADSDRHDVLDARSSDSNNGKRSLDIVKTGDKIGTSSNLFEPLTRVAVLLLERDSLNSRLASLRKRHRYLMQLRDLLTRIPESSDSADLWSKIAAGKYL